MRALVLALALTLGCGNGCSPTPADGAAVVDAGADAAPDSAPAGPSCTPCRRELPQLNCSPSVCEQRDGGALCCGGR